MSTVKMYIIYVVFHEKAKNEPFKCILLIKTWIIQIILLSLQCQNPPSLSTMLKCAGRFLILYDKHNTFRQKLYITSRPCFFTTIKRSFYSQCFEGRTTDSLRVYYNICIIKYFLNIISPNNDLFQKIKTLFANYPEIDLNALGFPQGWESEPLWR